MNTDDIPNGENENRSENENKHKDERPFVPSLRPAEWWGVVMGPTGTKVAATNENEKEDENENVGIGVVNRSSTSNFSGRLNFGSLADDSERRRQLGFEEKQHSISPVVTTGTAFTNTAFTAAATSRTDTTPNEETPKPTFISPDASPPLSSSSRSKSTELTLTPFSPHPRSGTKEEEMGSARTPSSPLTTSSSSSRSASPGVPQTHPDAMLDPFPLPPLPALRIRIDPGSTGARETSARMEGVGELSTTERWKKVRPARACASNVSYVYPQDDGEGIAERLSPARASSKGDGVGEGAEGVLPPEEGTMDSGKSEKKDTKPKGKAKVKKDKPKAVGIVGGAPEAEKRKGTPVNDRDRSKRKDPTAVNAAPAPKRRRYGNPTESIAGTALTRSVGLCPSPNGKSFVPLPGMSIYNFDGTRQGCVAVDVLDMREIMVRMGKMEDNAERMEREREELVGMLSLMRDEMERAREAGEMRDLALAERIRRLEPV